MKNRLNKQKYKYTKQEEETGKKEEIGSVDFLYCLLGILTQPTQVCGGGPINCKGHVIQFIQLNITV